MHIAVLPFAISCCHSFGCFLLLLPFRLRLFYFCCCIIFCVWIRIYVSFFLACSRHEMCTSQCGASVREFWLTIEWELNFSAFNSIDHLHEPVIQVKKINNKYRIQQHQQQQKLNYIHIEKTKHAQHTHFIILLNWKCQC